MADQPDTPSRAKFRVPGRSYPADAGTVHAVWTQTGRIVVLVKTPLGDPVPNATVGVVQNGMVGTTDANGLFDFGDVPADTYTVHASVTVGSAQSQASSQPQAAAANASTQFIITLPWTMVANWVDTQKFCGDTANLQGQVVPPPQPTTVNVDITLASTGAAIASLTGSLSGGTVTIPWVAKAQTANWRTDQIAFNASVPALSLTGTPANTFGFKARPTTTWALRK